MSIPDYRKYSPSYLAVRSELDQLCEGIISREITPSDARRTYSELAGAFLKEYPEKAELFKMVYLSRIERLLEQFAAGAD